MIEIPKVDVFMCYAPGCDAIYAPQTRLDVVYSPFDKTFRCQECGNEIMIESERDAEWTSVCMFIMDDMDRWERYTPSLRCFDKGEWPQASLYIERLQEKHDWEIEEGAMRLLVLAEDIPDEILPDEDPLSMVQLP